MKTEATTQLLNGASTHAGASLAWLLSPWILDTVKLGIADRAAEAVRELADGPDDIGLAIPVVVACTGTTTPPAEWWTTPLGRLCARHLTRTPGTVSRSEAAEMLGIHIGTISQMLTRGNTQLVRDGGKLLVGSVFAEIARRAEQ